MARRDRVGTTDQAMMARWSDMEPNPWNPNVMDDAMFAKERASIREFGFVDPITVRKNPALSETGMGPMWQIIDGEHRWRAGQAEGIEEFPIFIVEADDETAQQLTIVLNETRGRPDESKLTALVKGLAERRSEQELEMVLPYTAERLREMVSGTPQIDWDSLRDRRDKLKKEQTRWVERVYRMPADVARVIDDAVVAIKDREGMEHDWQALEAIAADVLASR